LVRLAQWLYDAWNNTEAAFNPSLVRLARQPVKVVESKCGVSIPAWFDWRYGPCWWSTYSCVVSIPAWFDWRISAICVKGGCCQVSIPAWFDWRLRSGLHQARCPPVSIPAWFDWRTSSLLPRDPTRMVSIPAWFDWRRVGAAQTSVTVSSFNPSLVRLARECPT